MKKGYNLDVVYRYMDKYDLTCTEFCKRCGITLVTFNHFRRGGNVRVCTIHSIAKTIGVRAGVLLFDEEE